MYKTTKGQLALVIMTHRHADHIAGFSKAERFKDFSASMVWMPYWEQFNDDKGKKRAPKAAANGNQNLAADGVELVRGTREMKTRTKPSISS